MDLNRKTDIILLVYLSVFRQEVSEIQAAAEELMDIVYLLYCFFQSLLNSYY